MKKEKLVRRNVSFRESDYKAMLKLSKKNDIPVSSLVRGWVRIGLTMSHSSNLLGDKDE